MKGIDFRNVIMAMTVAVLCLVSLAGAEEKKEAKIELVPVYEKTFEDTIIDVIFDETEITVEEAKALGWRGLDEKGSEEKTTIIYPKAVVKKGKIEFLDEKGTVKKSFSLVPLKDSKPRITVNFSKTRKFIGVVKSRKEFTMLNDHGELLWRTDISRVGYGWPYISPDGQYIVCVGDITGDFTDYYPSVWDKNGFVSGLVKEDERTKYELLHLDFTKNGEFFVVTFHQKGYTMKEGYLDSLILCLFDRRGNKIWQKVVGRGHGGYVSISEKGNYIGVVIWPIDAKYQELYLYKQNSNFCWKNRISLGGSRLVFSKDEKNLVVVCGKASIYYYSINSGQIQWEFLEKGTHDWEYIFSEAILYDLGNFVSVIGFRRTDNKERLCDLLYLFDKKGHLLSRKEFTKYSLFTKKYSLYIPAPGWYPTLLLNINKVTIFDGNNSKIITLKLNRKEEK